VLIEIKDKLVPTECPSIGLSMPKLEGPDDDLDFYNP